VEDEDEDEEEIELQFTREVGNRSMLTTTMKISKKKRSRQQIDYEQIDSHSTSQVLTMSRFNDDPSHGMETNSLTADDRETIPFRNDHVTKRPKKQMRKKKLQPTLKLTPQHYLNYTMTRLD